MAACNRCGEEIDFRYVDGRCVPIHSGGGWTCSPARAGNAGRILNSTTRSRSSWDSDFTRPTTCPVCHGSVFFVRHNGGSVWLDDLGWPWPKHPCFDNAGEPTRSFGNWVGGAVHLTNPKFGVVTQFDSSLRGEEPVIEVRLNDKSRFALTLRRNSGKDELLGSIVVISVEDGLLLDARLGEIPFCEASELPSDPNGSTRCPRCKAWIKVNQFASHSEYCREHFQPKKIQPDNSKPTTTLPLKAPETQASAGSRFPKGASVTGGPSIGTPQGDSIRKSPLFDGESIITRLEAAMVEKEKRITAEAERVGKMSWPECSKPDHFDQEFRTAQAQAAQLAAKTSPSIRKEVLRALRLNEWALLKAMKPQ